MEDDSQANIRSKEDLGWHITRRWLSYEGEIRSAILRVALLACFYAVQLVNFVAFAERTDQSILFHREITLLTAAWLFVSLAVLVALRQRFFPNYLKFAISSFDLLLVTACAALASGPHSPLVGCYFLIIVMSALRCSLPLVWFVTLMAMTCYWGLVGWADKSWFDPDHVTPPINQLVSLCSLAATGVVTGQIVRMIRTSSEQYVSRLEHLSKPVVVTSAQDPRAFTE